MAAVRMAATSLAYALLALLLIINPSSCHQSHTGFDNHQCSYVPPDPSQVHHTFIERRHVITKRSIDQPLRIYQYFDISVKQLSDEKRALVEHYVIPEAVRFWEKTLTVRRTARPIRLSRACQDNKIFYFGGMRQCVNRCEDVTKCGEVIVPEDHLNQCWVCDTSGRSCFTVGNGGVGDGIRDHDFILYVSAVHTERCDMGNTVAYTQHCQLEQALDRPVAGHVNLCPESVLNKPQELRFLLSTVKHEILHSLGFSVSLFAYYRDDSGEPLTKRNPANGNPELYSSTIKAYQWSTRVVREVKRRRWLVRGGYVEKTAYMMVTPRVKEAARKHFNCSELEGAELEDQGGHGTALTHWEKRLFENEAMTGTHTQNPIFSELTLAVMEDTGWYRVNYNMAQPLGWGAALGCQFAMSSCKEWMAARKRANLSIAPFCEQVKRDPLKTHCTEKRDSVALCNLIDYHYPLETKYQNFDQVPGESNPDVVGQYGGAVAIADYCPYIQEFVWKNNGVEVRGSHCEDPINQPEPRLNYALEFYGASSKCFQHDSYWFQLWCNKKLTWQHYGSGCYRYNCSSSGLVLVVHNKSYLCSKAGQILYVRELQDGRLHQGSIICPSCEEVCQGRVECPAERMPPYTAPPYIPVPCRATTTTATSGRVVLVLLLISSSTILYHLLVASGNS